MKSSPPGRSGLSYQRGDARARPASQDRRHPRIGQFGGGLMASERNVQFSAPTWLRDLGFSSWLLVGFVLIIVGLIWVLAETSTIVMPVILATVLGAVAGPAVGWLEGHGVARIWGAILVLVGLVAIGVLIFCLVFGGISAQAGDISAKLNKALDKIQGWLSDVGVNNAQSATEGAKEAAPEIR